MLCRKQRCWRTIAENVPPEYLPEGLLFPSFWFEIRQNAEDLARLARAMERNGDTVCTLQDTYGRMLAFARIENDCIAEFYIHTETRNASLRGLCRCAVRFIEQCHHGNKTDDTNNGILYRHAA